MAPRPTERAQTHMFAELGPNQQHGVHPTWRPATLAATFHPAQAKDGVFSARAERQVPHHRHKTGLCEGTNSFLGLKSVWWQFDEWVTVANFVYVYVCVYTSEHYS